MRHKRHDARNFFQKATNQIKRHAIPDNDTIYVIYHDKDLDGVLSAAMILNAYPRKLVYCIPFDHGQKLNLKGIVKGSLVYMVDCSLEEDEMLYLAENTDFYLFDHHYKTVKNAFYKKLKGERISGVATCMIVQDFLHPFSKIPRAVKLAGQYDVWDQTDMGAWNDEILPFNYGMKQHELVPNNEVYKQLLSADDELINTIIEEGKTIMRYEKIQAELMMKKFSYTATIRCGDNSYNALVINRQLVSSDYFKSKVNKRKHDLCIGYQECDGVFTYSLRSWEGGCNVREIAEFYDPNGGGHKYAAGFTLKGNIFSNNEKAKTLSANK